MGQILTVVGYAVGSYFGYPQLGTLIGGLAAAATTKTPNHVGPRLNDLRIQGTEYGQAIPWVAGSPRLAGQVVWSSGLREIPNRQKTGKGGGGKVTTFTYEVDLLILLTENVTSGVAREWMDGGLVFNGTTVKAGTWNDFTVYTGEQDQLPDPTYEAAVGVGNAPAYRGHTSIMISGLQLGSSGHIRNLTSEIKPVSGGIDERIRLLANFPDGTPDDQSLYEIGYDEFTGGVLSDGLFQTNFNTSVNGALVYTDTSLSGGANRPLTYEVLLEVPSFESAGGMQVFSFAPIGRGSTSLPLVALIAGASGSPTSRKIQFTPTGIGGGTGHPMYYEDPLPVTSHDRLHVAVTFFPDDTASMWWNGVRVKNRVAYLSTLGTPADATLSMGLNLGSLRNVVYNFYGARIARAEVYSGATIDVPEDITGDLTNANYVIGEGQEALHAVVTNLMRRAGYEDDEFDVSGIISVERPVRGMSIGQVTSTRGPLETLQSSHFFESYTSDKVYFTQRQVNPLLTIPFEDLGASTSGRDEAPLDLTTGNELELPAQISLSYANVLADYNVATEQSDRLISGQETNQSLQLGLGMIASEAKSIVDAMLFDQLASLTRTTVRLPLKYAVLRPGHVFLLTDQDGRTYRVRSLRKKDSMVVIEHECVLDDVRALISAGITADDYTPTTDIVQLATTLWETLDIPPLRDADASLPGPYVAITPERTDEETEWPGAAYVRSWGADDFEQIFISGDACVMGTCDTELLDFIGGSGVFDETQKLRVRVYGELASTTRAEMLGDLSINAAAVGVDGRWELLRFRFAELIATEDGQNVYDLSSFVRGQRGTEHNMGNHDVGDSIVLLDTQLRRMVNQNSDIDAPAEVKAVTLNLLLSDVTAEPFTDAGVALKPFSVANLRALQEGSDLVVSWQRRTRMTYRYGGAVGVSVPLGELVEAYRVSVYDGVTLVNTYPVTSSEFTYAAADIASDGFAPGDTITFVVAQLSDVVGPGYPETITGVAP